jgi:small-conductance mechanosensitive channel
MYTQMLIAYGRTAISIALTILIAIVVYIAFKRVLTLLGARGLVPPRLQAITRNAVKWLLAVLVAVLTLQNFGVPVASVWATISTVLIAVAVGFVAVWSVLSNLLCSVLLVLVEPFAVGDDIEVVEPTGSTGLRGRVVQLNLLYTTLAETTDEGLAGPLLQVPNNIFFQKTIRKRPTPGVLPSA